MQDVRFCGKIAHCLRVYHPPNFHPCDVRMVTLLSDLGPIFPQQINLPLI